MTRGEAIAIVEAKLGRMLKEYEALGHPEVLRLMMFGK